MNSGQRIESQKKNSFLPNNFENEFLSEYDDSQSGSRQEESSSYQQRSQSKHNNLQQNSSVQLEPPQKKGDFSVKYVPPPVKDKEEKAIKKAKNDYSKISANISQLKDQYNQLNAGEAMFFKRDQKKEKEIVQFLKKKQKEKKDRGKKLKKIKQKEQKKREQALIMQQEKSSLKRSKVDISRLKSKQQRDRELDEQKRKQQEVAHYYEKYKDYKRFHEIKEEQDKQRVEDKQQELKEILWERKKQFQPVDWDQLDDYRRKHDQNLRHMNKLRRAEKEEEMLRIIEENNKLQAKVYRGQSHQIMDQERAQGRKKRREGKDKFQKVKVYEKYVRENFVPRTHQQRSADNSLEQSLDKSNMTSKTHREVKRYRFFQGVSYGQVFENKPLVKSEAEQKKMGNDYLLRLRSMPKKKKVQRSAQFSPKEIQILNQKLNSIEKVKKEKNPLYDHSKRKSLDIKVSNNPSRDELAMLMLQLQSTDNRMKAKQKVIKSERHGNADQLHQRRKEVNQGIIENIERKLSLLSQL